MHIGIVGSGNIGGTLARRLPPLGHDVAVANTRGPESLAALAEESGARAATVEDAVRDAEVVVLAIPLAAVPDLPADLFRGKVVIDANNYYPSRDGRIEAVESGTPSSAWTAELLPGARIAKAFNTILASRLLEGGRPAGDPRRTALPVAGEPEARAVAMELVEALGFDPVDAGGLEESWRQEPDTPVYGTPLHEEGVRRGLAGASR